MVMADMLSVLKRYMLNYIEWKESGRDFIQSKRNTLSNIKKNRDANRQNQAEDSPYMWVLPKMDGRADKYIYTSFESIR